MTVDSDTKQMIKDSIISLLDYCQKNNWAGYDPFDGLESRIFRKIPFFQNRICRLLFIQAMKRSPINFRPLFLVPKAQNPKGLALFASTLVKLSDLGILDDSDLINSVLNKLIELRTQHSKFYCWGYNFDWQSRNFFLPKFSPNIICTTFAGNALMDAFDKSRDEKYLDMAISAGQFILNGLNTTENDDELCFSYTPLDRGQVHNANLLGAAYLARLYRISGDETFIDPAHRAVRFSVRRQQEDGSWAYGEGKTQRWIDNFHTGYNLIALKRFSEFSESSDFEESIQKGFRFYKAHFFADSEVAKYYHDRKYPIDIHAIAYSIITLIEFASLDEDNVPLAERVFLWTQEHMLSNKGCFFYQKKPFYTNRISYMRWSQAWILYALVIFTKEMEEENL